MARARIHPHPPRMAAPDLPPDLEPGELTRSGDITGARVHLAGGRTDAGHSRISECTITAASVDRLDLTGATVSDVYLEQPVATEVIARDATWRTVIVRGGRIGSLDLSRGRWDAVLLEGVRIDYLSAGSATLRDVQVTDCRITAWDAPGARIERLAFSATRVDEFDTREMQAVDLDLRGLDALSFTDVRALRGATMSGAQAAEHATSFAAALGIDVRG
ncbi:hypothetical protein AB3M83_09655 [Microbacterium sp. 179-B 1A2 NHS]|uniref:hypothetical protein n=1 Tax=Microbacterium sp. 179-B 1A2 NHS TaxID=3142383 RepID=UPI0039A3AE4B